MYHGCLYHGHGRMNPKITLDEIIAIEERLEGKWQTTIIFFYQDQDEYVMTVPCIFLMIIKVAKRTSVTGLAHTHGGTLCYKLYR